MDHILLVGYLSVDVYFGTFKGHLCPYLIKEEIAQTKIHVIIIFRIGQLPKQDTNISFTWSTISSLTDFFPPKQRSVYLPYSDYLCFIWLCACDIIFEYLTGQARKGQRPSICLCVVAVSQVPPDRLPVCLLKLRASNDTQRRRGCGFYKQTNRHSSALLLPRVWTHRKLFNDHRTNYSFQNSTL